MLKLLRQLVFKNSNWKKSILVQDGSLIDTVINDVPEQCLDNDVSPRININYLSKCEQNEDLIKKNLYYKGAMIGSLRRLFVSIPTSHPSINKYVYVHYLVDTASPHTTLTHRALCAIHQRPYSTEIKFPRQQYQIGGKLIHIHLSNPNPRDLNPSHSFPNVNRLGMDFLTKYLQANIKIVEKDQKFQLRLVE